MPKLRNCSVVFFHHVEKTAGTTLRALFQRYAQTATFDTFSFLNRQNKLHLQLLLKRLHAQVETNTLNNTRIAVEIHVGGSKDTPYFYLSTLRDLVYMRHILRQGGCTCNLVGLVRAPLMQTLSWYSHFVGFGRVPLSFWRGATNCASRISMGLACHDSGHAPELKQSHFEAVDGMWRYFDLVGYTEAFDEFVVLLARLVGMPAPAYQGLNIHEDSALKHRHRSERHWARRSCESLIEKPPPSLVKLIQERLDSTCHSARTRFSKFKSANQVECTGYGPCTINGKEVNKWVPFDYEACRNTSPLQVITRLCGVVEIDERVYHAARERFDKLREKMGQHRVDRAVERLRESNLNLRLRADAQKLVGSIELARLANVTLRRDFVSKAGVGVPWRANEFETWYHPYARARLSCVNCSGDVVPEFDIKGCWPLWAQFAPDEMLYKCHRRWTVDPALSIDPRSSALPCWETCWASMNGNSTICAPSNCDAVNEELAWDWRRRWEFGRAEFERQSVVGGTIANLSARIRGEFVGPIQDESKFVFNVF